MVNTASMNLKPGSMEETLYDIWVGIYVGTAHSLYFMFKRFTEYILLPPLHFFNIHIEYLDTLFQPAAARRLNGGDNNKNELKVIGCGYGRTGTYSLSLALTELGYPSLHTQHLYQNDNIFNMLADDIFIPSIQNKTATMGKPNLQLIADSGFTSTADLPFALYFKEILKQYPKCKFILTKRENSEIWFKSWNKLTDSITKPTHYGSFVTGPQLKYYTRWLYSIVNNDNRFLTAPLDDLPKLQNKKQSIKSYETHNKMVKKFIPSNQLLEYNVKEGWEPLCKFLDIPSTDCPSHEFPKSNSALSLQVQGLFAMIGPIILIFLIVFTILLRKFYVFKETSSFNDIFFTRRQAAGDIRRGNNSTTTRTTNTNTNTDNNRSTNNDKIDNDQRTSLSPTKRKKTN